MKHLLLLPILIACDSKQVSFTAAEYSFSSISGTDVELSVDLTLSLDYGDGDDIGVYKFAISGEELTSGTLTQTPEDEWLIGCPTNYSATTLQTALLDTAIDFGDLFEPAVAIEAPMLSTSCTTDGPAGEEYPSEIYLFEQADAATGVGPCPGALCLVFN